MFDITTLELSVMLVIVVSAAAAITVSLFVRKHRSTITENLGGAQISNDAAQPISESSDVPLDLSDSVPISISQEGNGGSKAHPVASIPAPISFQAELHHDEITQTTFSSQPDTGVIPSIVDQSPSFESQKVSPSQETREIEIPTIDSTAEETQLSSASVEQTPNSGSMALPTDSAAIENITSAPAFQVTPQAATIGSVGTSAAPQTNSSAPSAYCVKCKSKKQMKDPTSVTMKNGRPAVSGYCSDCGTRVFRIGKLSTF